MSDHTTLDARKSRAPKIEGDDSEAAYALVLAWSAEQPRRVGEALVFPESAGDETFVFGRGEIRPDDGATRVFLCRQRPGVNARGEPLDDGFVSRKQLSVGWHVDGVRVENLGKLPIHVGTQKVSRVVVKPGETLEIDKQLLFVCVERPATYPSLRDLPRGEMPEFGQADTHGFVGESAPAWELRDRIAFVAARTGHVLLLGESGTGKELVAQAIHARSSRASKRLVARNAATFPAGLIDAELFGNVANYPNAGMAERPGLIGEADGSTLFLDEIGELPENLQTHLLRVLDEGGEYQRLGDARRRKADIRLIAATNRPLEELKPDLAARLRLRLRLPGLNDRLEDVPLLARHLLRRTASKDPDIGARFFEGWDGKKGEPRLSVDLARALVSHFYATHVRQLDALLWASLTSSKGGTADFTDEVRREMGSGQMPLPRRTSAPPAPPRAAPPTVTADAIRESMARHNGVKDRVWRELGLPSRFALHRLMKKLGIGDDEAEGE